MNRGLRLWGLYALGLALALAAMGWVTLSTLRMEHTDAEKQKRIELDSRTRIALWRMDSMASSLVSLESSRPWFHYRAFHEGWLSSQGAASHARSALVPSPLLLAEEPHILLHFQIGPTGAWSSPQVPSPSEKVLATRFQRDSRLQETAAERLQTLSQRLKPEQVREALFHRGVLIQREQLQASAGLPAFSQGTCAAFWNGDDLLLARQLWMGGQEYLQGCWIDWPVTRQALLSTVLDLLPGATLVPTLPNETSPELRRTNTVSPLLARFNPGSLPPVQLSPRPPIRIALGIGWTCTLLAFFSGALVLRRSIRLSEQRLAFASAVTHELRTPLTTVRLYSGLLASGMVTDEAEQKTFLHTLAAEADRLDHLVKNVLSFARLETRPDPSRLAPQALGELLDRIQPQLIQRVQQVGLELCLEIDEEARQLRVPTDPALVEQILLNLADNACKYAATAKDRRLHVDAKAHHAWLNLRVRDHGPGLDPDARRALFKAFGRSSRRAALGVPGVGLGLALCRRLARSLGGDLRFVGEVTDGACFELRLPVLED